MAQALKIAIMAMNSFNRPKYESAKYESKKNTTGCSTSNGKLLCITFSSPVSILLIKKLNAKKGMVKKLHKIG
jgi:hypothetical protein